MRNTIDRHAVAARIRGLIGGQDQGIIERTARRLGVGEVSLRISVDDVDPHPTLEVVSAIVSEYGVDPTWLISGDYDTASHRLAIDDEREFGRSAFARLLGLQARRDPKPDVDDPDLKLEA